MEGTKRHSANDQSSFSVSDFKTRIENKTIRTCLPKDKTKKLT